MLKRFTQDLEQPPLESGEEVLRRGVAAQSKGYFGGRWGPLVLTNRRLLWHGRKRTLLPFKKNSISVRLEEIHSVDKGNLFNFLFGGMCIRIRKKNGRVETLYEGNGQLDDWIAAIGEAMTQHTS
jgi:hypothetical protein